MSTDILPSSREADIRKELEKHKGIDATTPLPCAADGCDRTGRWRPVFHVPLRQSPTVIDHGAVRLPELVLCDEHKEEGPTPEDLLGLRGIERIKEPFKQTGSRVINSRPVQLTWEGILPAESPAVGDALGEDA